MRFRISLLLTAVVLMFASFSPAQNCTSGIVDKANVIRNAFVIGAAAKPLVNQGVDVRVVTVDHNTFVQNGSSLAGVETMMEANCPNWVDVKTGTRKANLFVVMVAPQDRQKNIFLGSFYAGAFDVPSTYSQLANASFKAGQWEQGIANTLNGTGTRAIAFHQQQFAAQQQRQQAVRVQPPVRAYTQAPVTSYPTQPQTADSGMSGVAIFFLVLLVLGVIATVLYFVFRDTTTSTTTTTYDGGSDYVARSASTGYPTSARRYAAAAPSTVVVHEHYDNSGNNLVTGMLIGEALSRPNYNPNPSPVYVEQPTYVAPTPTYEAPAPVVADAPDSTWEEPTQQAAPDTNFETPSYEAPAETPSFDPPSSDFGSSNDSGF
jgi:hypothetical protein